MMTDDSYSYLFKKRVQIQKRGWNFALRGGGAYTPPACSLIFFSGRGTRVYLEGGYVPSCCNVCSYQGVDEEAEPGAHGSFFQGVFAP